MISCKNWWDPSMWSLRSELIPFQTQEGARCDNYMILFRGRNLMYKDMNPSQNGLIFKWYWCSRSLKILTTTKKWHDKFKRGMFILGIMQLPADKLTSNRFPWISSCWYWFHWTDTYEELVKKISFTIVCGNVFYCLTWG